MHISLEFNGRRYQTDLQQGISLASPLGDPSAELKAWSVPDVLLEPVKAGDWEGSVAKGASVNFYNVHLNPHGNGTHTECRGHITREHHSLNQAMKQYHFVCRLLRMEPEWEGGDGVVKLSALKEHWVPGGEEALILVTGEYSAGHDFSNSNPPYFEPKLLAFIRENGIRHFLTDLPSVDKEQDGGRLSAHNAFWPENDPFSEAATITEMLSVPAAVEEGLYLLNLQFPALENDAAPSRPVIYPLS